MKIGIASDHGGYKLKIKLLDYLKNKYEILDLGTNSEESVDYPDFAFEIGKTINDKTIDVGILICKTGIGMSIAANKVKGVSCAKLDTVDDAKFARIHNGSNVVALAGSFSFKKAKKLIDTYLIQSDVIEERHMKRINKIKKYENEH